MDFHQFFSAHHADFPLGKMQAVRQTHLIAADAPLTHPLLADDFLKTADVIRVQINGPKTLSLPAIKEFMRQIAAIVPENGIQEYDMKPGTLADTIVVEILAGSVRDSA